MFAKNGSTAGQNKSELNSEETKEKEPCTESNTVQYLGTRIEGALKILSFEDRLLQPNYFFY